MAHKSRNHGVRRIDSDNGRPGGGVQDRRDDREGQVLHFRLPGHHGDSRGLRFPVSDTVRRRAGDIYHPSGFFTARGCLRDDESRLCGGFKELLVGELQGG